MSDLDLDPKQENLNKLGIELCEHQISYVVRNDVHYIGETAINNYIESCRTYPKKNYKLAEEDKDYLSENSHLFMVNAMENLNI
jgi:hypothetical protein